MAKIYAIKIKPCSSNENKFKNILEEAGVKNELLMCRRGKDFGMNYDEYIISEGLYKIIHNDLMKLEGIW